MTSTIKPLTYGEDAYNDGAGSEMYIEEIDNPGTQVAYVLNYGDFNKTLALAQLFAAAPDNYECNIELAAIVRELCAVYNHPLPKASLDRSDAAISKARGEK